MNYLAHAYLSFQQPAILAGNIFSDFVKGKKKFDFPEDIQAGIMLHRTIDRFTDEHAATREANTIFKPGYRLYSGAFTDIVYDHFLANDNRQFTAEDLYRFSQEVYTVLDGYIEYFPEPFRRVFPWMKQQNWLYNYRRRSGIARSFEGLVARASYISESATAFKLFEDHYEHFQRLYDGFFPEVKLFALETLQSYTRA